MNNAFVYQTKKDYLKTNIENFLFSYNQYAKEELVGQTEHNLWIKLDKLAHDYINDMFYEFEDYYFEKLTINIIIFCFLYNIFLLEQQEKETSIKNFNYNFLKKINEDAIFEYFSNIFEKDISSNSKLNCFFKHYLFELPKNVKENILYTLKEIKKIKIL